MGIIGIVSALTLPNLNSSTGDKEKIAKVKKIYQNLDDAIGRAVAVYGPFDEWFLTDTESTVNKRFIERITEFMKLSKSDIDNSKIVTADGIYLEFANGGLNNHTIDSMRIYVDIDGKTKGSNIGGKDLFRFEYNKNLGLITPGNWDSNFTNLVHDTFNKSESACTVWILRYDNADYLKFKNESGLCPNGTTVTEANPRCK